MKFAIRAGPSRAVSPGAAALSAVMYVGCTLALLTAVPQSQMAVVQGLLQAVDTMSASFGVGWILLPLAVLMAASIAGSTSAWVSGSARILFVCGLDRYLPKALGKVHPRHHSPHVALIMFGFLASSIIAMSFIGASVQEAYLTLLDLGGRAADDLVHLSVPVASQAGVFQIDRAHYISAGRCYN